MVSLHFGGSQLAVLSPFEELLPIPYSALPMSHSSARQCLELRPRVLLNATACAADLGEGVR